MRKVNLYLVKHYSEFGIKRIRRKEFVPFQSRSQDTHIKAHSAEVRITHPIHPLRGQSFPVVPHQTQKDTHVIEIQLAGGERRFVPLDWTDRAPPVVTVPGARFLLANLLSVCQRVELLLQAHDQSGILPPNDTQIQGGRDAHSQFAVDMVQADSGSTHPGDSHSGPDAAAPTATDRTPGG